MNAEATCLQVIQVAPYVLGELDPTQQQIFEDHLSLCQTCSTTLEETRTLIAFLDDGSDEGGLAVVPGRTVVTESFLDSGKRGLHLRRIGSGALGRQVTVAASIVLVLVAAFMGGRKSAQPTSTTLGLHSLAAYVGPGSVTVTHTSNGTELAFHLTNIPAYPEIGAWVRTAHGPPRVLCWWPLGHKVNAETFVTNVPSSMVLAGVGIKTRMGKDLYWHRVV